MYIYTNICVALDIIEYFKKMYSKYLPIKQIIRYFLLGT